jgi:hypothetical protein
MGKRGNRRTGRLGLLCAVALAACGAFASHASAETKQVEFSFDDGRINIGQFKGERLVDPAAPDRIGSLIGLIETTTGDFNAPASGVVIPDKVFENVDSGSPFGAMDVVLHFSATGPVSGNLAPGTGVLRTDVLNLSAEISVYQASDQPETPPTLFARCAVSPVPLPLSSSGELVDDHDPANPVTYSAAPFAPRGAAVASWDSLPPSQSLGGTFGPLVCPLVDQMAAGPGGVWLAGLADLTEAPAAPGASKRDPHKEPRSKKCKRAKKKKAGKKKRQKRKRRCRKRARAAI